MVGRPKNLSICEFEVAPMRGGARVGGKWLNTAVPPYMPANASAKFHPSGNSVCYAIQWGMLMGCDPIYLMGFTLRSGSGYDWGTANPITQKPAFYDLERALAFLRFVEGRWPGRVRLLPGWEGPIYDVFHVEP